MPEPVPSQTESIEVTEKEEEANLVEPELAKEEKFNYVLLKNSEKNGVITSPELIELGSWFQDIARAAEKYQFFHTSISTQQRAACEQLLSSGAVTERDLPVGTGNFGDYLKREEQVQGIQDDP